MPIPNSPGFGKMGLNYYLRDRYVSYIYFQSNADTNLQVLVKTGYLQLLLILEVFAEHFSISSGINMDPSLMEEVPTGALSLTLSIVSIILWLNNFQVLMSLLGQTCSACIWNWSSHDPWKHSWPLLKGKLGLEHQKTCYNHQDFECSLMDWYTYRCFEIHGICTWQYNWY